MKIQLVGTYSEEFENELRLTATTCRELSGLGRRPYLVEITTSKLLRSKLFSLTESNTGVRTFHITLSDQVGILHIQELMPKIFCSILRKVVGTSRNFKIRVRDSYETSLASFSRLLGV